MDTSIEMKWNQLLRYLAESEETSMQADAVILAGNCLPYLTLEAGKLLYEGRVKQLVLSGGIGHATSKLRANYARLGYQFSKKLSEAEMNAAFLFSELGISEEQLIVEMRSTNCGENAQFSLALFDEHPPAHIYLMNDPILQRRTRATFEKVWGQTHTKFENYVPIVPELRELAQPLVFKQNELSNSWTDTYFKALVLGELARMQDTEMGYGSKGMGYMNDIFIPNEIQKIFLELSEQEEKTNLSRD